MDIIFIRHAQGEHTLNIPTSLYLENPALTRKGEQQAKNLVTDLSLTIDDLLIISPLKRTLQTAAIFSANVNCKKIVHPHVGPRIFPFAKDGTTLPCDQPLSVEDIQNQFPQFSLFREEDDQLWNDSMNTMSENTFIRVATPFLEWCKLSKLKGE
ncbi:phosphoglycerate mutase [Bacillus sp. TS-2]|nr:phosphoglycerate mutase [Bacillus sp. TS-2]